jgi:hypothetical protein
MNAPTASGSNGPQTDVHSYAIKRNSVSVIATAALAYAFVHMQHRGLLLASRRR